MLTKRSKFIKTIAQELGQELKASDFKQVGKTIVCSVPIWSAGAYPVAYLPDGKILSVSRAGQFYLCFGEFAVQVKPITRKVSGQIAFAYGVV